MIDKVSHDILAQQADEIGHDQGVDLQAVQQKPGQHNPDDLFPKDEDGFQIGLVRPSWTISPTQEGYWIAPQITNGTT